MWHQLLGSWKFKAASNEDLGPALSVALWSFVRSMWKSPGAVLALQACCQQLIAVKKKLLMWVCLKGLIVSLCVNWGCAVDLCLFLIFFTASGVKNTTWSTAEAHGHLLKYTPSLEDGAKDENTNVCSFKPVHIFKRKPVHWWPAVVWRFSRGSQVSIISVAFVVCYFLCFQCVQLYEAFVLGVRTATQRLACSRLMLVCSVLGMAGLG